MTSSSTQGFSDCRRQTFSLGQASIEALVQGSGPPIVLLHGAGANTLANWLPLFEQSVPAHTIIGVELPGSGDTHWPQDHIVVDDLIQALSRVIDEIAPDQPVRVAGYSTGAMLAIGLAGVLGKRVTHLAAAAPWVSPDAQLRLFFSLWQQLLVADPQMFARFNTLVAFSSETLASVDDPTLASIVQSNTPSLASVSELEKLIAMNLKADVSLLASLVTARTTIVSFDDDRMIPPRHASKVLERIAGGRLVSIAAGHAGPWEATPQFMAAIREALDVPTPMELSK